MVKEKGLTAYDAILMDFVMPVMDGPDATKALRELGYLGPVIGCTGNTLYMDLQRFYECGCDRVIGKPFLPDVFHQYMDELALLPPRQLGTMFLSPRILTMPYPINTSSLYQSGLSRCLHTPNPTLLSNQPSPPINTPALSTLLPSHPTSPMQRANPSVLVHSSPYPPTNPVTLS